MTSFISISRGEAGMPPPPPNPDLSRFLDQVITFGRNRVTWPSCHHWLSSSTERGEKASAQQRPVRESILR